MSGIRVDLNKITRLGLNLLLRRILGTLLVAVALVAAARVDVRAQTDDGHASSARTSFAALTSDQVVQRMMEKNAERAEALRGFRGTRSYRLEYKGFPGNREAHMVVNVDYQAPDHKEFTVVSQGGSKLLIDRVLKKLLESEREAMNPENRARTALTADNYNFILKGYESDPGGAAYVLQVEPKTKNKFLYSGKIWVDANDFAVTRIEAEPARNPSFWIKKTEIRHVYRKIDEFWLPQQNYTVTMTRLGGRAILTIDYQDYRIAGDRSRTRSSNAR
jgi:hypothetical protein